MGLGWREEIGCVPGGELDPRRESSGIPGWG